MQICSASVCSQSMTRMASDDGVKQMRACQTLSRRRELTDRRPLVQLVLHSIRRPAGSPVAVVDVDWEPSQSFFLAIVSLALSSCYMHHQVILRIRLWSCGLARAPSCFPLHRPMLRPATPLFKRAVRHASSQSRPRAPEEQLRRRTLMESYRGEGGPDDPEVAADREG